MAGSEAPLTILIAEDDDTLAAALAEFLGKKGHQVDLARVTMPVLNIFGEQDHLVPPASSRPISEKVGSKDVTTKPFDLGHIGMYVSGRSQKELAPTVANWLIERSGGLKTEGEHKKAAAQNKGKKEAKK